MLKLATPITIGEKTITELDITESKFTAGVIIDAEKEFLVTGGIFPTGQLEESKAFLLYVAAKMTEYNYNDFRDKLSGKDFLAITSRVRGFFSGSAVEDLISKILEKQ
ncbi:MAG: hypothetical protein ACRCZO_09445 [Cetobacterium sp.]|uniref:hypothetical protein n=1 Tax=Cetobacterium sp. ZOR0034 TaxID=1339239 RepID=UPI000648192E|nr:hypothetical protein [Cetobacterium sp. ZOR0034]